MVIINTEALEALLMCLFLTWFDPRLDVTGIY